MEEGEGKGRCSRVRSQWKHGEALAGAKSVEIIKRGLKVVDVVGDGGLRILGGRCPPRPPTQPCAGS